MKNLYLVERTQTSMYDEYSSMVVVAPSHRAAKKIQPSGDKRTWRINICSTYIGKAGAQFDNGDIVMKCFVPG